MRHPEGSMQIMRNLHHAMTAMKYADHSHYSADTHQEGPLRCIKEEQVGDLKRCVADIPRVALHCDVNKHSLSYSDQPCRGLMHVKPVGAGSPSVDVVEKIGKGYQLKRRFVT
ncbi:hypothetical protein TNCV_3923651 [Trichonephila clavipes]|nr:hypothetical protein TNCV_3923651 [Trichonephila clavipes]